VSAGGVPGFCNPSAFPGTVTKLFHNLGPQAGGRVRFEDVSLTSGIGKLAGPGLGVVCADFDGDGWPDVFVANDGKPNRLWINQKNSTFKDEAVSRGIAYTQMGQAYAGMGVAVGDVNDDGLLDLYVTHLTTESNTLWVQGPRGMFRDRTQDWQLTGTRWRGTGFGTLMADFDSDGRPDIAVVNGRVQHGGPAKDSGLRPYWEPFAERNQVLANVGGKFKDVSVNNPAMCKGFNVARGLACADLDSDGAPDLLITTIGSKARLFRNVAPSRGHWISVRAIDPRLNRDAIGAEVRVDAGGTTRLRLIHSAESYLSASSPVAQFGLGDATTYDTIRVAWPDGLKEVFAGGAADRAIELRRGEGRKE
jgi:enediyne biosynthesis protein E4